MGDAWLMPIGGKKAFEHMEKTLLNSVEDGLFAWGLVPGKANTRKWKSMKRGDIISFVASNGFVMVFEIERKERDHERAKQLWGEDENGMTWELMFFMKKIFTIEISKRKFLESLGYSSRDALMGSRRMKGEHAEKFYSLFMERRKPPGIVVGDDEVYEKEAERIPDEELERLANTKSERVEFRGMRLKRSALVKAYVKKASGYKCEICGFSFKKPDGTGYVEVAHIMPLSKSLEDSPQNAVALCPNCHRMLDQGSIEVKKSILKKIIEKVPRARDSALKALKELE